jgi:hypothetical protein
MHIARLNQELNKVDIILNDFLNTLNHDFSSLVENIWTMRDNLVAINSLSNNNYLTLRKALSLFSESPKSIRRSVR